jgi:predicted Rossmann fold nucleotide-binding protein DprA/Smf involved in DNA uptake
MTSNQTITIFGSRDIDRNTAYVLFEQHLSSSLSHGTTWVLGGSRGLEQWAVQWLLEQNERVWIVVAYTRNEQPPWLHPLLDEVDRVIELRLPKRKTASAIRNRHNVALAQIVFGFWSGKGGSTIKTLKHALTRRREVHAIPLGINSQDGTL